MSTYVSEERVREEQIIAIQSIAYVITIAMALSLVSSFMDWSWLIYALMLLAQNASFTLVSRARNSKSVWFHALASIPSNGIWFLNLIIGVQKIGADSLQTLNVRAFGLMAFYTTFTVLGSIAMHHVSMHYLEKGKRKV